MLKSIKKNYIYNLFYQSLLVLAPLITTPYISRVLGADGVGTASFVESIASYFTLFATLGTITFGQREISYTRDDKYKSSIVFYNVFVFKFIVSIIVLLTYLFLCITVFKSSIYYIFAINILAVTFDITWFFQGLESFSLIATRNSFFRILSIIFIFVFVKSEMDINLYCLSLTKLTFFTLLSNISLVPNLIKEIVPVNKNEIHPFKDVKTIISLFLPTIAIQIYTVLDKTMIGLITKDAAENGYYEQSIKISKFLLFIVTALSAVVIPRIGYYYNKGDDESLKKLLYKSYRFTMFLALPMTFGLFAVSNNIVPWFLGEGFDKAKFLIKILSFLLIAIGLSNVTGLQYMVPTKKQKLLTISLFIGAIFNFILNLIMIRYFKSVGAAIASIMAETIITISQFYLVRTEISFVNVFRETFRYIISAVIMFAVVSIVSTSLASSVINSLIMVICGGLIYIVSLVICRDKLLLEVFSTINNAIKNL